VVSGVLISGQTAEQWCDRQNFLQLYRAAIAGRRSVQTPAHRNTFNHFLLEWHRINKPGQSLLQLIGQYRGLKYPLYFFERNILINRFHQPDQTIWREKLDELKDLIANGEIIVLSSKGPEAGRRHAQFRLRGDGYLFSSLEMLLDTAGQLSGPAENVYRFLKENGTSYLRDLEMGTGLRHQQLRVALQELADRSLASCENYQSFLRILESPHRQSANPPAAKGDGHIKIQHGRRHRPTRSAMRKTIRAQSQMKAGRWFLTTSFAIMGKPLAETERAGAQARLLLQRYGILVKEFYRRERGLLPWYNIFQALKRLEWQGLIRRGYFVDGLSGIQFALPEALDLLEKIHTGRFNAQPMPVLLSTMDPALPYGGAVDWDMTDAYGNRLKILRSPANHIAFFDGQPIFYSENSFQRLSLVDNLEADHLKFIVQNIRNWLKLPPELRPRNRIEISQINGRAATKHKFAKLFADVGYEKEGDRLVLWPSAI
jgi:ATP-dependent Lhr-like helicase